MLSFYKFCILTIPDSSAILSFLLNFLVWPFLKIRKEIVFITTIYATVQYLLLDLHNFVYYVILQIN